MNEKQKREGGSEMNDRQNYQFSQFSLGTCYYPEHWNPAMWRTDLNRMLENGIQTIRIAEFAWSKFEEREGEFNFDFFDSFMDVAEETGMKVIFCTPTATPPAWLTEKYPEVLNAQKDGTLYRHGLRRHYNYNSFVYQEFARRITRKLGEHYGKHPNIVGWQIDNEFNCETALFYSESDSYAFRQFLREKYETLDRLNEAWGAVFWNQTYTSWEEIFVPRTTYNDAYNPHMMLDYYRFVSVSTLRFCKIQADELRRWVKPGDFITTNGMFENMDNHKMEKEMLDVYMYDSYPNFAFGMGKDPKHSDDLNDRKWSRNLTEVRSICRHFGIMEQQSGADGSACFNGAPAPKPGQMTLWALQSLAHGADYISFFRWRTCRFGTEMYWNGILDYSSRDNRRLKEVKSIYEKLQKIQPMAGSEWSVSVAQLKDYDNQWDAKADRMHGELHQISDSGIFRAAQLTHTALDYIYLQEDTELTDLTNYKLLFCPHAVILTEDRAALLRNYVEQGGILVMGCRTGYKELDGICVEELLPGKVRSMTGADVYEYTVLGPADDGIYIHVGERKVKAEYFCDLIAPLEEGISVGTYNGDYYAGVTAMTERAVGKGKVIYYGSTFTQEAAQMLLEYTGMTEPWKDTIEVPEECELVVRETKDGQRYFIVLNYLSKDMGVQAKLPMWDCFEEREVSGEAVLKPYEVKVLRVL